MKLALEFLIAMGIVMLIVVSAMHAARPREAPIAISASVHRAQSIVCVPAIPPSVREPPGYPRKDNIA